MKRDLATRARLHKADAADRLTQIALGLLQGQISVRDRGRFFQCHPGSIVDVELRGEEDERKGRIVIELAWRRPLVIDSPDER